MFHVVDNAGQDEEPSSSADGSNEDNRVEAETEPEIKPEAEHDSLPTMRGLNHVGLTVPNMEEAVNFFENVIGCTRVTSFGPFRDDEGTFMKDLLNVNPRAVINEISLLRCADGSNIELFDYSSPDQETVLPRNSDIGGNHLAFYVDDIDQAAQYLNEQGLETFLGPFTVEDGPAAGQTIMYFLAPWGTHMEIISYPNGLAYETNAETILFSNVDPSA